MATVDMVYFKVSTLFVIVLLLNFSAVVGQVQPEVNLQENIKKSAVKIITNGQIPLSGSVNNPALKKINLAVTTSFGKTHYAIVTVIENKFKCHFPKDFSGDAPMISQSLYISALDKNWKKTSAFSSEITLILLTSNKELPDLPLVFMDDFIDSRGKKDKESAQWSRNRHLVNLFMNSQAARLMQIPKPGFDLAENADFTWFKNSASQYDFDFRDRDWNTSLKNRVARGYWQAVWNTWFNGSNNHYWDGKIQNKALINFRPYTFTNDLADLVILYQMLTSAKAVVGDNRRLLTEEVLKNLLATQHKGTENFALKDKSNAQEHYTAGAFRYGMFESGEWLVEGKGWFANPNHKDYILGGVFNGRALWALGVSLDTMPNGPLAKDLREAISLCLSFCLDDKKNSRYVRRTKNGNRIWSTRDGENGYLLLGMLNAAKTFPELSIPLPSKEQPTPLKALCVEALNGLSDIARPDGCWSNYDNVDAVNILALATGVRMLSHHPQQNRWKTAAEKAANRWMAYQFDPNVKSIKGPHFTNVRNGYMTFFLTPTNKTQYIHFYQNGHWLQALAELYSITDNQTYLTRAQAILSYYCGNNPLHVRLLSEIGSVPNGIADMNHDGVEDWLGWNAYPESTAFVQMGLIRLLEALEEHK